MVTLHECTYPGCGKRFDRKYNLKCHRRIHSDEKPYLCSHARCERAFRWKSSLNHHLMSLDHASPADRLARKTATRVARPKRLNSRRSQKESQFFSRSLVSGDDPVIAHHFSELQALSVPQTSNSIENSFRSNASSQLSGAHEFTQIPQFSFSGSLFHFERDTNLLSSSSNLSLTADVSILPSDAAKVPVKNDLSIVSADEMQYATQTNSLDLMLSDALNEPGSDHALSIY